MSSVDTVYLHTLCQFWISTTVCSKAVCETVSCPPTGAIITFRSILFTAILTPCYYIDLSVYKIPYVKTYVPICVHIFKTFCIGGFLNKYMDRFKCEHTRWFKTRNIWFFLHRHFWFHMVCFSISICSKMGSTSEYLR